MKLPPDIRSATRSAFTLIELMVVLALVAVMVALIIPEMRGTLDDALLRSNARKLVSAFSLASSRAIAFGQPHHVRVESKTGRFFVERVVRATEHGATPAPSDSGSEGTLDTRIALVVREPANVPDPSDPSPPDEELAPARDCIAFRPDGTADAREIVLRDPQGFRLALQVQAVTARVRIVELPRENAP